MDRSDLVAVLLLIFVGIQAYKAGIVQRVGQAINGQLTVGGQ